MVTTVIKTWHTKYDHNDTEFIGVFDREQDYIDAMFRLIVIYNYGRWLKQSELSHKH